MKHFKDFDLENFWDDYNYDTNPVALTDDMVVAAEKVLGCKLPQSYIELLKTKNGGMPKKNAHRIPKAKKNNYVLIEVIRSIGGEQGIDSEHWGNRHWIDEWEYPEVGVLVCNGGHEGIMLDYSLCGKDGEPQVLYVDNERGRSVILAKDFESFIRGLVSEDEFGMSEADAKQYYWNIIENGEFSGVLAELCQHFRPYPTIGQVLRSIGKERYVQKGYFAFHDDELSYLFYDLQFWLYTNHYEVKNKKLYLGVYEKMVAMPNDGKFTTGGYSPDFVETWFDDRRAKGMIETANGSLRLSENAQKELLEKLGTYK